MHCIVGQYCIHVLLYLTDILVKSSPQFSGPQLTFVDLENGEGGGEVLPKFSQIKNTERVYSVQLYNAILNGIEAIPKSDAIHDILLDSTTFSTCMH